MRKSAKPSFSPESQALDVQWMQGYLRDETDAFQKIYAEYSDAVYGYLAKRVSQEGDRDDLFQKVWMKFHRSREQWSSEYSLLQWLFVISRSVVLDRYRELKRSPYGKLADDVDVLLNIPSETSAELLEAADAVEEAEIVKGLVREGLAPEQIIVIREYVFQEEDYKTIAQRLGKNSVSLRKGFSRAMEKLRKNGWGPPRSEKGES